MLTWSVVYSGRRIATHFLELPDKVDDHESPCPFTEVARAD